MRQRQGNRKFQIIRVSCAGVFAVFGLISTLAVGVEAEKIKLRSKMHRADWPECEESRKLPECIDDILQFYTTIIVVGGIATALSLLILLAEGCIAGLSYCRDHRIKAQGIQARDPERRQYQAQL